MIPLRATESVKKFPKFSVYWIIFFIVGDLISRFWTGSRLDFLVSEAFAPSSDWSAQWGSIFLYPHFFSMLIGVLFTWVFSPRLFETRNPLLCSIFAVLGARLVQEMFFWVHPNTTAPILSPECLVGFWIGMSLRKDIWSTLDTFVIGPGWNRVFEVPTYVVLFFWYFYLMIANLFLVSPFSEAPMLYLLPLLSMLLGLFVDIIWTVYDRSAAAWKKNTHT